MRSALARTQSRWGAAVTPGFAELALTHTGGPTTLSEYHAMFNPYVYMNKHLRAV